MSSPLCDQSQLPCWERLINRAVTVSCFSRCCQLSWNSPLLLVTRVHVTVCLGHFAAILPTRLPTVPHVSADKERGTIKHVGHILAQITHVHGCPAPLIFHREGERAAYIILTEAEWRETSLRYLHTHALSQIYSTRL